MSSRTWVFANNRWDRIRKNGDEPDITEVLSGGVKYVVMFFFWMIQSDWLFGGSTKDTAPCGYSLCAGARPSLVSISFSTFKTQDHNSPNLHSWIFILPVVFGYLLALKFEGPGWFFSFNLIKSCPIHQFAGHSLPVQERLGAPYRNIRGRDIGRAKKRWGSSSTHVKTMVSWCFMQIFHPKTIIIEWWWWKRWVQRWTNLWLWTKNWRSVDALQKRGHRKQSVETLFLQDPSLVFFHKEISRCPIGHQFLGITVNDAVHSDSLVFPLRSQSNHLHTCSGYLYNLLYIYIYVGQGYKYT